MTKTQALKEAVKRWGKKACIEDMGPKYAGTPESRLAARLARAELHGLTTPTERKAPALAEFDRRLMLNGIRMRFKVGYVAMGMFFSVQGEGDTWKDAFAAATKAKTK